MNKLRSIFSDWFKKPVAEEEKYHGGDYCIAYKMNGSDRVYKTTGGLRKAHAEEMVETLNSKATATKYWVDKIDATPPVTQEMINAGVDSFIHDEGDFESVFNAMERAKK